MAKRAKESAAAEEHVPAEMPVDRGVAVIPVQEAEPGPAEPSLRPVSQGPGFGQRLGRFLWFLVRVIVTMLVVGAIAAGLYLGLPLVYQRYILPVQQNTDQLNQLRDQQSQNELAVAGLQSQYAALATAQAGQAQAFSGLETRVTQVEAQIAAHTQTLAALDEMQTTLQAQDASARAELERQVDVLRALELLSRARLYLYQSNFGLARQDVQAARDVLAALLPNAPEPLAQDVNAVLLRLDLTLSNLPDFPVAASGDLDIAWQTLLGRVPPPSQPTVTATPADAFTPTPVPTLTPEATASPTVVP